MLAYALQLYDAATNRKLSLAGQFCVVPTGDYVRSSLYDENDTLLTGQAQAFTGGLVRFRTAESVAAVDIYGMTTAGYAFQVKNVSPTNIPNGIYINTLNLRQTLLIPFHYTDLGASVAEIDSGFDLAKDVMVMREGFGLYVAAIDATETLDVGTDSTSANNDPDGFATLLSVGVLGFISPQVGYTIGTNSILVDVTGGTAEWTLGENFSPANTKSASKAEGTDSTTTKNGLYLLKNHTPGQGGATSAYVESITLTPSAGWDTGKGLVVMPLQLPFQPTIS